LGPTKETEKNHFKPHEVGRGVLQNGAGGLEKKKKKSGKARGRSGKNYGLLDRRKKKKGQGVSPARKPGSKRSQSGIWGGVKNRRIIGGKGWKNGGKRGAGT